MVRHSPARHKKEITMNTILTTVMATTMSVLVNTSAMAQTQPTSTPGEMKSAVEQQATQEKQAAKDAVQAEKAKAQQSVKIGRASCRERVFRSV